MDPQEGSRRHSARRGRWRERGCPVVERARVEPAKAEWETGTDATEERFRDRGGYRAYTGFDGSGRRDHQGSKLSNRDGKRSAFENAMRANDG